MVLICYAYVMLTTFTLNYKCYKHVHLHIMTSCGKHYKRGFQTIVYVTHWKFRYFKRIGDIGKLGQYDLL